MGNAMINLSSVIMAASIQSEHLDRCDYDRVKLKCSTRVALCWLTAPETRPMTERLYRTYE